MNGMTALSLWALSDDDDNFDMSHQFEFPPTSTIAEISQGSYFEFDDQSHADIAFYGCSFLDINGVARSELFLDIDYPEAVRVFGRNGLVSATIGMRVANGYASCVINFFFWNSVN